MTIFQTVKGTFNTAVDTLATVTQSLVEKNRTNAKLNRLRLVMKNESELMNRAYIALGKQYYENAKNGKAPLSDEHKKLFDLIEKSKSKIAKARDCYRKIVDSQNDIFYGSPEVTTTYDSADIVDITVACSNESDYDSSPFDAPVATQEEQKATQASAETSEKATEKIADDVTLNSSAPELEKDDESESPDGELF